MKNDYSFVSVPTIVQLEEQGVTELLQEQRKDEQRFLHQLASLLCNCLEQKRTSPQSQEEDQT
ncbi:hypothetical protein FHR92_002440 [Fontibacillus solani]|uniref:Uncharacterized protein n=1 Tax=Fontibacillus solani TaxID=1572857 RepID=A0A7W3XRW2_9BACL|nr:hypothetical protein [Fontibacillus solani]MBA9085968.1 hypothetical protein [Fontibacillus solani]